MLKALIAFTIVFLIVTIGLIIFWNYSESNNSNVKISELNLQTENELYTKVYSMKKIDSLTAVYNLPFTEKNRNLEPSDIKL